MISKKSLRCIYIALLVAVTPSLPAEEVPAQEGHAEEHLKNELALFVGVTHERRENGGALGLEYERRVNNRFGVGVIAERTWGDLDFWVVAVPFVFHVDRWKFAIAPGIEDSDAGTEELVRLAVGYEIETHSVLVTPLLGIDFVDGEQVYVLGASFGLEF